MKMSNKAYDILKWVVMIVLPALAALYCGLAKVWGLPYGDEIVGTITSINTFLGVVIGVSNSNYKKANTLTEIIDKYEDEEQVEETDNVEETE